MTLLILSILAAVIFAQTPTNWPLLFTAQFNYLNTTSRGLVNFGTYYYDYSTGVNSVGKLRIDARQCGINPTRSLYEMLLYHL
jgi:hypothetical protein